MPDSKIELGQQLLQKFTAGSTSTRIQTMLDTHGRDQTAALLADKFCEKNPELCKTVPTSSDQNVTIQETFDESEPVGDQFRVECVRACESCCTAFRHEIERTGGPDGLVVRELYNGPECSR
jgi:hypothetical protein